MARLGPVIMSVVGDAYIEGARLRAVVWEGASTSGDTIELRERTSGAILWRCRTADTQTYLGISWGEEGIHAPSGFRLSQISSGQILVYLAEKI